MDKRKKILLLPIISVSLISISGCDSSLQSSGDNLYFNDANVVVDYFDGLGVEWGTYENPDRLSADSWERSLSIMDRLNPDMVRCMLNYDWFVTNFDDLGDTDKNNDTWDYNFSNKLMDNSIEVLRYCDDHDIDVAFGCWNVPGNVAFDEYDMMKEITSDIRWAKMTADILEYLVSKQGIRCIKYFVNSNEPNYNGVEGKSKNYNNTFEIWAQGVKNVRHALDERGLNDIAIIGGDTTGFEGTDKYFTGIAKDETIRNAVGDYGFHLYCPNMTIDTGDLAVRVKSMYDKIKGLDEGLGVSRKPHIWEAGLFDGKDSVTDSNALITTFAYGLRMADYTLQCAISGVTSVVYWDFDDGMYFMPLADGSSVSKGWGMFSSLGTDSAIKQRLRPWYHSSVLLTNLMKRGSKIIDSGINDPKIDRDFRSMGVVGPNDEYAGIVAINQGAEDVVKKFTMLGKFNDSKKVYVYIYNQDEIKIGEDGFVKENLVLDASLKSQIEINVPSGSMVVLSSKEL